MRYKHFKPLIHNFTHSFVGGCNYLDDRFIFEDLFDLAKAREGKKVIINWLPITDSHDPELSERVKASIDFYQQWLPKMAASLDVDIVHLLDYRTEVYLTKHRNINVKAIAHDDRGKEYEYFVEC